MDVLRDSEDGCWAQSTSPPTTKDDKHRGTAGKGGTCESIRLLRGRRVRADGDASSC